VTSRDPLHSANNARADLADLLTQLAHLVAATQGTPPAEPEPRRQMPTRVLLTVEEAAEQLGIGRTLAYKLVKHGEIESVRIGRLRRVPADAVHEYARRLTASQPRPAA
jgi:excisionase family DNA binding protein